jgi:hypothetical protein
MKPAITATDAAVTGLICQHHWAVENDFDYIFVALLHWVCRNLAGLRREQCIAIAK